LSSKQLLNCTHEAGYIPFQIHCFSENLVVPEIEPWPLDLETGTLTTGPQRRSTFFYITYINSVRTSQESQYISVLQPETLTTRPQRQSTFFYITYINSVRTSQESQYISVLQPETLTTRPQRQSTFFYITYINSVRTSQESQYISAV
jgi:hypothetical protein